MSKGRIERGAEAQDNFSFILEKFKIPISFVAPKHSNKPDVIFSLNGLQRQAEVKNTRDFTSLTIFDKTVNRGKPNPDVDLVIKKFKGFPSFEKYVDHLRKVNGNEYTGFVGDEGIEGVSGKLPVESFRFDGPAEKRIFIEMIRNHWAKNGDDFFVIMEGGGARFAVYSTTMKAKRIMNMNAPPFSTFQIKDAYLATTGAGGGDGKLRVALKVTLNNSMIKTKITSKFLK
jgi:hypothetical protein